MYLLLINQVWVILIVSANTGVSIHTHIWLSVYLTLTSLNVVHAAHKFSEAVLSTENHSLQRSAGFSVLKSSIYLQHSRKSVTPVIIYTKICKVSICKQLERLNCWQKNFLCFTTQVIHCSLTHLLSDT